MLKTIVLIICLVAPVICEFSLVYICPAHAYVASTNDGYLQKLIPRALDYIYSTKMATAAAPAQTPLQQQQQQDDKKRLSWGEYGSQVYNEQYEKWMPWIEDLYLRWFTKDNKTSYATRGE